MPLTIVVVILSILLLLCLVFGWVTFYLWRRTTKLAKCAQISLKKEVDPLLVPTYRLSNAPVVVDIDKAKTFTACTQGTSSFRPPSTAAGDEYAVTAAPTPLSTIAGNNKSGGLILLNEEEKDLESISTWSNNMEPTAATNPQKSSESEEMMTEGDDDLSQDDISELSSPTLDSGNKVLGIHEMYPDYTINANQAEKKQTLTNAKEGIRIVNPNTLIELNNNQTHTSQILNMATLEPLAGNAFMKKSSTAVQGDSNSPNIYKDIVEGYLTKFQAGKRPENAGSTEKLWLENKLKRQDSTSSDISEPTWTESVAGMQQGENCIGSADDHLPTRGGGNKMDTILDDPFKTESVGSSGEGSTIKAAVEKLVKAAEPLNAPVAESPKKLAPVQETNSAKRVPTMKPPIGLASAGPASTNTGSLSASGSSRHLTTNTGDKKRPGLSLPKTPTQAPVVGHRKKL